MNFFEHQDHARRQTGRMILLFILAVIVIVVAVNLSVSAILISTDRPRAENVIDYLSSINPVIYIVVSLLTLAIIGLGTMVRMAQLAKGGKAVAELVGARLITCDTSDLKEKMLLNVVEEMAIASGTAAPRVYVMDEERSINAFAAGYSPNEAIIAVTKGTLDILNRDELQGVIAHEFSHILNGDMRLNIRLLGVLNGILIIGTIGMYILRGLGRGRVRSNRDEGKGIAVMFLIGLSLAIIGYAGVFFGRLIKSAVSRQREYLADASAVQFTRNPTGIGGALKKILFGTNGSLVTNRHSEELSHMFFSQGIKLSFLSNLFSTHPPLEERIKRIDPSFNPRTRKAQEMKAEPGESAPVTGMATEMASSLANPANIGEDEIIHTKAKTVMSSI